ncbi:TonB-dependent receptor [Pedobacter yulinensis]|uniref:TonB-dependent receptor n=1 Tax=Pedobacter yulinensis TaxID=2126353 RepID=A0A2T3HIE5_9SPHI|nr:TonB-dependent receptor [Pedobacter yulinensis]PST82214.1 TonB-dependent receptor [Pedobacter yulinensis]
MKKPYLWVRLVLPFLLCFFCTIQVFAQTTVKGTVLDEAGEPIPGATIMEKGTTNTVTTDASGKYQIKLTQQNATLVVSFVGYQKLESAVNGRATVDVMLKPSTQDLSEVVVTGYTTQRKKDLTGSVAIVDVAQLKSQPAASAVEAMQGKAPGVQIINDGAPGSTPQIRIRGNSTINNNDPLYVVDGMPYEGKLSWLNQNDIESMQVLKDASAASIYGARANNGVVIITTKIGTEGPPKINLDVYYGTQAPRKDAFPEMMNPMQYAEYLFASYRNAGKTPATGTNYGSGATPTLPVYLVAGGKTGQEITPADADPSKYLYSRDPKTFYQITRANQSGTNWFDEITENAPIQNYQLSTTGGGENSSYAFTGGYLNQRGTVKYTGFERYNIRSNTRLSAFNKRLRFGENAQYSYSEGYGFGVNPNTSGGYQAEGSAIGWAYRIPTIIPVYDVMGNFAGSRGSQLGNAENPLATLFRAKDNKNRSNFFFGNVFGEVDVIKGLTAKTSFGLRYENYNGISMRYPNLEFSEGNNSNNLNEYQGYTTDWTWTNTLTYNLNLERHRLTLLAGTEAIKSRNRQLNGGRNDFFILGNMDYYYLNVGASNISNSSTGSVGALFSLFAKADYSFNDRYLLSATIRRDGSSNFGSNYQYGYFPAASAAWRLSEEDFLKESKWVNDLKLRVGYGETGNQRIPGFQYLDRFQSSIITTAYPINGGNGLLTGVAQTAYENPNVRWEALKSLNIGLDFTLFGSAIDGSLDWYNRKTTDMLYPVPLPSTAVGMGASPFTNIGDMTNEGFELSLFYHYGKNKKSDFTFDAGINLSRNVNTLTKLAPSVAQQPYNNLRSLTTSRLKAGEPFAAFYGYAVDGIYTAEDLSNPNVAKYTGARVGGLKFRDMNGSNSITPDDRTTIGNPYPDFIYSLSLNAGWKNWDIAMFFNGSQGNDLYEATRYFTDFPTFDGARSTRLLDAWSPANPGSMTPSPYNGVSDFEYASSSYYIQDGSFFRMKNLQIGYKIPPAVFGKTRGISSMRIYASATNLFTLTKYTGLDPEVSQLSSTFTAPGVDLGIYPTPRQFLLGINVGF